MTRRHIDCAACGFEGIVDEPRSTCPKCDDPNVSRCTVIECCGEDLYCHGFTNTCPHCGADYNWAGQRLAPREQWCDGTDDTLDEVLRIK